MAPPTVTDPSTTEKIIRNKWQLREGGGDLISKLSRGEKRLFFRRHPSIIRQGAAVQPSQTHEWLQKSHKGAFGMLPLLPRCS